MNFAFPLPARGTVLANPNGEIPISRYVGNPAHPNDEWERTIRIGYEFDHRFNESIGLVQNFRYFWLDWTSNNLSYPTSLSEDGRILTLTGYKAIGHYYGWRTDTAMDAALGPARSITWFCSAWITGARHSTTDLKTEAQLISTSLLQTTERCGLADLGFYLQDQAKLLERVTVTAGVRYDYTTFSVPIQFGLDAPGGSYWADAFSPKVGITYEAVPGVAAYFNWSRSFYDELYVLPGAPFNLMGSVTFEF